MLVRLVLAAALAFAAAGAASAAIPYHQATGLAESREETVSKKDVSPVFAPIIVETPAVPHGQT